MAFPYQLTLPTREHELWALALSIERKHGADGPRVIAERIDTFALSGESEAVHLWREVARRYERLGSTSFTRPQ
jgi:hypothetical protein